MFPKLNLSVAEFEKFRCNCCVFMCVLAVIMELCSDTVRGSKMQCTIDPTFCYVFEIIMRACDHVC